MKVTITKFRQDLFKLVEVAIEGEPLQFVHKGIVFRVVPESSTQNSSKLSRLTGQPVVSTGADLTSHDLLKEMESEWEKDWSEL